MTCTSPCFDCPYLRDSEKLKIADTVIFDFVFKHHTIDGGHEPHICPEQEDICFGQILMIANGYKTGLDPFSEIGEAVEETAPNDKEYFSGSWEFIAYHEL